MRHDILEILLVELGERRHRRLSNHTTSHLNDVRELLICPITDDRFIGVISRLGI
jgi:hypothetical protein